MNFGTIVNNCQFSLAIAAHNKKFPFENINFQLLSIASYNWKLAITSRNYYFQLKKAAYNWQLPVTTGICYLYLEIVTYNWQLLLIEGNCDL